MLGGLSAVEVPAAVLVRGMIEVRWSRVSNGLDLMLSSSLDPCELNSKYDEDGQLYAETSKRIADR